MEQRVLVPQMEACQLSAVACPLTVAMRERHPSGITFTHQGFPDFGPAAKAQVRLKDLTGTYKIDAAMANRAAGFGKTPRYHIWHHVEDGVTMQLVPSGIHNATRHTGGSAVIRNGGFDR